MLHWRLYDSFGLLAGSPVKINQRSLLPLTNIIISWEDSINLCICYELFTTFRIRFDLFKTKTIKGK